MVDAYSVLRHYRLGHHMLEQSCGVPIGGSLSSAILDVTLSYYEHTYHTAHAVRPQQVLAVRYVDDSLMASKSRCQVCLMKFSRRVHGETLTFGLDDSQSRLGQVALQKFLHLMLCFDFETVLAGIEPQNGTFAFSGRELDLKKFALEPYLGKFNRDVLERHCAELLGRISLWSAFSMKHINIVYLALVDILRYIRFGYKLHHVRRLWTSLNCNEYLFSVFKHCSSLIAPTNADLQVPLSHQMQFLEELHDALVHCLACVDGGLSDCLGVVAALHPFWAASGNRRHAAARGIASALADFIDMLNVRRVQPTLAAYCHHVLQNLMAWTA